MFAYFFFHENFSNSTQDTHLFLFLIKLHAIHPLVSRLLVKINIFTFSFTFTSVFTGFDNVPTKFIYKINSKLKSSPEYELLRRFDHIHYQPISYPCELSNIALYYFIYILKRRNCSELLKLLNQIFNVYNDQCNNTIRVPWALTIDILQCCYTSNCGVK